MPARPRTKVPSKLSLAVVCLATLAYPFAVYLGFGRVSPVWLALGLVLLALARAWAARDATWLFAGLGAGLLALASLAGDSWLPVKLYPVLVNACLLVVFGASLLRPPTVVERLARLGDPSLPDEALPYVRKVTWLWCHFFVLNGCMALATALWATDRLWLLYNGLLAYLLMGALFGAEWLVRRRVRARFVRGQAHV